MLTLKTGHKVSEKKSNNLYWKGMMLNVTEQKTKMQFGEVACKNVGMAMFTGHALSLIKLLLCKNHTQTHPLSAQMCHLQICGAANDSTKCFRLTIAF